MTNERTILITGVTGHQGGAVAQALAAIRVHNLPGDRLATVLTGSNLRDEHLRGLTTGG